MRMIFRHSLAGGLLVAACVTNSCWAACQMIAPPTAMPSQATVSGSGAQGTQIKASPIAGNFTFKCDSNTNYRLTIRDLATGPGGSTLFRGSNGAQVHGVVRLRNVCGSPVNMAIKDLPLTGYSGSVAAGQACTTTFDILVPGTVASNTQLRGDLIASVQVVLDY